MVISGSKLLGWRSAGYWLLAILAIGVAAVSLRYISFNPAVAPEDLRPNMERNLVIFVVHTVFGAIALGLGIWQFLPRTRRSAYHRQAGRVYVICCLVSATAGFYVAFYATAGALASAGFAILAILWIAATALAYFRARNHDFVSHQRWMMRSYALTSAAITLRLVIAAGAVLGLDPVQTYIASAWLCWIINLLVVEVLIRYRSAELST